MTWCLVSFGLLNMSHVNSYGHVWTVSSHNLTFFLSKFEQVVNQYFVHIYSASMKSYQYQNFNISEKKYDTAPWLLLLSCFWSLKSWFGEIKQLPDQMHFKMFSWLLFGVRRMASIPAADVYDMAIFYVVFSMLKNSNFSGKGGPRPLIRQDSKPRFWPYFKIICYSVRRGVLSLKNFAIYTGHPRGFGDLGRMAIYFQGAGEHWLLFSGSWRASL